MGLLLSSRWLLLWLPILTSSERKFASSEAAISDAAVTTNNDKDEHEDENKSNHTAEQKNPVWQSFIRLLLRQNYHYLIRLCFGLRAVADVLTSLADLLFCEFRDEAREIIAVLI